MANKKEVLFDLAQIILGNLILAIGVGVFVLPQSILSGGVAGVAVALQPFVPLSATMIINLLTIGLFFSGMLFLGKKFAINTVLSSIMYPLLVTLISEQANQIYITDNKLLASIYAGVFIGVGIGLVFRTGASTGGMDIPPLIINKFTGFPLPTLVLIIDGITVSVGILAYGIEAALIGLVSVYICSGMINKVLTFGGHQAKNVMIISAKHEEIMQAIQLEINRGATILEATGGYTREKRPVIMVVLAKKQFPTLNKLVTHIDPEAFVVVSDTYEVQGLGFTYQEEL